MPHFSSQQCALKAPLQQPTMCSQCPTPATNNVLSILQSNSQQCALNSVAERKHRHVIESVIALLHIASMPIPFWGEAILITVFWINRLPSVVLKGNSPFYKLFKTNPNYHYLWVYNGKNNTFAINSNAFVAIFNWCKKSFTNTFGVNFMVAGKKQHINIFSINSYHAPNAEDFGECLCFLGTHPRQSIYKYLKILVLLNELQTQMRSMLWMIKIHKNEKSITPRD